MTPINSDKISISGSISLKKDEYSVDRKNSMRQDAHNLLESCGFAPTGGSYTSEDKIGSIPSCK
jgi:chromosome segregation ATPase